MPDQAQAWRQLMALKKESIWGTGVTPDVGLAITEGGIVPQLPATYDNGKRGVASADFAAVLDAGHGEATMNGWVYPMNIGHFLQAMFGGSVKTGVADPWLHTFAFANTVPSYTIEEDVVGGAGGGIRCVGSRCGSLAFNYEAASGALMYTSTWMGKIPSIVTPANPAIVTELPFEGWRGTLTSTGLDCKAVSADINFTRDLHVEHTGCDTKDPYAITSGQVTVEGSMVVVVTDMSELTMFLAGTIQPWLLEFTLPGPPIRKIGFQVTSAFMGASPLEYDRGQAGLRANLSFRGLHNATDTGSAKVLLTNGQTTVY
jgi:hypothetical protein